MSVVTVTILAGGRALPPELELVSVDVRRELNRLPTALLLLNDGDLPEARFPVSDSGLFKLGTDIEIAARYEGGPGNGGRGKTLFKGIVVRHGIASGRSGSFLQVELRDKAVRMTRPRRSRVSLDATDSDVFTKLAGEAGLQADVEATAVRHPALVQADCSDWDWLVTRAEAIGQVVAVTDGRLRVARPPAAGAPVLSVTWGTDIAELDFECDALGQDSAVDTWSWDSANQKLATAQGQQPARPGQGRLSGTAAADALGFGKATLVAPAVLQAAEAKDWATAVAARNQMGLLRGRVRVQGTGIVGLLDAVEFRGVAKAFAGQAPVTGLCHRIAAGEWTTDLQFGLSSQPHHRRPDIASAPAAGLLPPASRLQVGLVEAVHDDPQGEHRIRVQVPSLGAQAAGLWARVAAPDAGKERGFCFRPEPGDEVVLGFFNDDPRQPVVLGALFGSKHTPPAAVLDGSNKNTLRGLVTRSGLTLALDDEKKQLSLQTPSGAKLLMDDDGKAIVLSDQHGNKITLDQDGIRITSAKDLKLEASGNVTIQGSKIDLN